MRPMPGRKKEWTVDAFFFSIVGRGKRPYQGKNLITVLLKKKGKKSLSHVLVMQKSCNTFLLSLRGRGEERKNDVSALFIRSRRGRKSSRDRLPCKGKGKNPFPRKEIIKTHFHEKNASCPSPGKEGETGREKKRKYRHLQQSDKGDVRYALMCGKIRVEESIEFTESETLTLKNAPEGNQRLLSKEKRGEEHTKRIFIPSYHGGVQRLVPVRADMK